jgi:hypothetical protein
MGWIVPSFDFVVVICESFGSSHKGLKFEHWWTIQEWFNIPQHFNFTGCWLSVMLRQVAVSVCSAHFETKEQN